MERYFMFLSRNMTMLPNAIYRFNAILIKLPMAFFTKLEQKITVHIETQKARSQSSLEKEEWSWRNQPSWLQTILQSYIKTVWHWHKDRSIDLLNKIESPEINHAPMAALFFTKETRICNGTKIASSISDAGKTGQLHVKEWN